MGREGFEPSTLGLRVQLCRLQQGAPSSGCLKTSGMESATNYAEPQQMETSLYAHPYAQRNGGFHGLTLYRVVS
jgi:hypothetical protein